MVISHNSQLGLRFKDKEVKVKYLELNLEYNKTQTEFLGKRLELIREAKERLERFSDDNEEHSDEELQEYYNEIKFGKNLISETSDSTQAENKVAKLIPFEQEMVIDDSGKYFYICDSVYKAAELIKVNTGFTGRTLKDIEFGNYTYLMGKHRMVRFFVRKGALRGFYFDDKQNVTFDFGIEMGNGAFYYTAGKQQEFTNIMQVLTFVELGDIEILELQGGRNNGGKKDVDKITNTTKNTVFVVDSTWNKIIIRTDGFAVRGHFRLQPCGKNMADRTLIWISAFEKHGYKRIAKASIAH